MATAPAQSFEDLDVWQHARRFVTEVYRFSATLPKSELFGLTSQLRRAAVSVSANIAEGFGRRSQREKQRFYNIAQGSLEECHCLLVLACDLGWGETQSLIAAKASIARMLNRLIAAIEAKPDPREA